MMIHRPLITLGATICLVVAVQADISTGLLEYWTLDGNANAGINPVHNASFTGDVETYAPGKFGQGIDLERDGVLDYLTIGGPEDAFDQVGQDITVSLWVSVESLAVAWQAMVANGEGSAWRIARRDTSQTEAAYAGGATDIWGTSIGTPGFHHVVGITEHGVETRLWIDGVKVMTGGVPSLNDNNNDASPTMIGNNPDRLGRAWDGIIDDVGIWGEALTDEDVLRLWNNGVGASIVSIVSTTQLSPNIESFLINTGGVAAIEWKHTGHEYTVECSSNLLSSDWHPVEDGTAWPIASNCWSCARPQVTGPLSQSRLYYRVKGEPVTPPPEGMVLIPAGSFQMGDNFGEGQSGELPVHAVSVSAFYMDRHEVTKTLWDEVANWGAGHGYDISASGGSGKAADHPVQEVTWYECVKWCNARSEKENRTPAYYTTPAKKTVYRVGVVDVSNDAVLWGSGYRLPTEAEWEKAARGGLNGQRFPWGAEINHDHANYRANGSAYSYDTSPYTSYTYHPDYDVGGAPYTSPVGSFAPNGYGLYDMAGNVWESCWDWYGNSYYGTSPGSDPRGPASGSQRVLRGSAWGDYAVSCRTADRYEGYPGASFYMMGFRTVQPAGQ